MEGGTTGNENIQPRGRAPEIYKRPVTPLVASKTCDARGYHVVIVQGQS